MGEAITKADPVAETVAKLVAAAGTSLPVKVVKVALGALDAAAGVLSWQNPESVAILATVILDVTTKSTAACTVDVGPDGDGAGSADTLLDGLDVGAAALRGNSFKNGGTNGVGFVRLDAKGGTTDWITASKASGAAAGLVGSAYIIYIPVS